MNPSSAACLVPGNRSRRLLIMVIGALLLSLGNPWGNSMEPSVWQGRRAALNAPAPEFPSGMEWMNTKTPLKLKDLRGKIVLLDFWTYCCINCMHILPDLEKLEEKYANQLVVIGVHSAKFTAEKDSKNIRQAIMRYHIKHPVVNDHQHKIWDAYLVNAWPTFRLIDPEGKLVMGMSGEGKLDILDENIRSLIETHRAKKTLNETPLAFDLETTKANHEAPLYYPGKLLADKASQRLFISDSSNNRIIITDLNGKKIDVIGTGDVGKKDGSFDKATFDDPQGLALWGERLFVADRRNCVIREINLKDRTVSTFAGNGKQMWTPRAGPANVLLTVLNSPWDLCLVDDQLYVALAGNHQIWRIDLSTKIAYPHAGDGQENIKDGPLAEALFSQPSGLSTDGTWLYVADSEVSAIRRVALNPNGVVQTIVGTGLFNFGDRDGAGKAALLQHALAVVHHQGKLYVADTYNNKIKVIDPKSKDCRTFLGDGKPGLQDDPPRFSEPAGLSLAGDELYVADTNNHAIRVIDLKTKQVRTLTLQDVAPPQAPVSSRPSFLNASTKSVKEITLPAQGEVTFHLTIRLAAQMKLNADSPIGYLIEADQMSEAFETFGTAASQEKVALTVPAERLAGASNLKISLVFYPCLTNNEGLCFVKSQIWKVPIKLKPDAAERTFHLETDLVERN